MNDAQKRLAKRVLSMNSSRRDKKQDLNSSLYDKRTFNEVRDGLADYPADKLKNALSGYITDPIFITNVTNDNGNITVNYRFLDENLNEEFVNAEIGYGLDYIENIHLFSSRQDISSGRTPMVHRLKSVNSSKMTVDQAKQKYKELLTQCYISVYDHKLDVNDPQIVEYRKQMNELVDEFGYLYNTMDGYIKSLDKKYKNTIDFTAEDLDSGLFSKKEKPSEEILKMYKQLKKSIDNLIKAGTPASNSNLKNMQNKATEFEKKYDSKALKMALAASRRGLNSSAESGDWKETYHVNHDRTLASMVHYNDITGEYDGEVVWIDENGKPQQKTYKGKYNPRLAFAPFVSYWITQDTKQTTVEESNASAYIEACSNIKEAVKNKWTSENSSRRAVMNSSRQRNTDEDNYDIADHAAETYRKYTLKNRNVRQPMAVKFIITEGTSNYNGEILTLDKNRNLVRETISGSIPAGADDIDEVINDYTDVIGDAALYECSDAEYDAQRKLIKETAEDEKAIRDSNIQLERERKFFDEYGVKPNEWNPVDELMRSANSSRRRRMNSSRRRLNSAVNNTENCYFVTDDRTLAANLEYDPEGAFIIGFIRGQRADGTLVDENVTEPCHTDVPITLMWDLIEEIAERDDFKEVGVNEFNDILLDVNALFTDVRKSRLEKYVDYRRTLR